MTGLSLILTFVILSYIMLDKMIHVRNAHPTRPDPDDSTVREQSLRQRLDELRTWAVYTDNVTPEFSVRDEFTNLFLLAVIEEGDAYDAAKWLDLNAMWDIDTELVLILHAVYSDCADIADSMEQEWVMRSGTRIHATSGQQILVTIGGEDYLGTINQINRATATAEVTLSNVEGAGIVINAEDIREVL